MNPSHPISNRQVRQSRFQQKLLHIADLFFPWFFLTVYLMTGTVSMFSLLSSDYPVTWSSVVIVIMMALSFCFYFLISSGRLEGQLEHLFLPNHTRHSSPSLSVNQSNVFIKPFLRQLMSQSAVQEPSLKPHTAGNAGVEARNAGVPPYYTIHLQQPSKYHVCSTSIQHLTTVCSCWCRGESSQGTIVLDCSTPQFSIHAVRSQRW
jgi:hypothetical protein